MLSERYPRTDTLTNHLPTPKGWPVELASGYSKQFRWLEWNLGPHTFQPYAIAIWPHCNIHSHKAIVSFAFIKWLKSQKSILGVPKKILHLINKRQKAFGSISEIHFVLNKQGTLNPIWTGLFASLIRLGAKCLPPPPLLTWLFRVRWRWNLARIYYG